MSLTMTTDVDCLDSYVDYILLHLRQDMKDKKELIRQEVELEYLMSVEGNMRYNNKIQSAIESGQASNTGYGRLLLRDKTFELAEEIEKMLSEVKLGKAGMRNSCMRLVKDMCPKKIAYIALKTLLNTIDSTPTLQYVSIAIGGSLEDELRYELFKNISSKDFNYANQRIQKSTTYVRKRTGLNTIMAKKAEGYWGDEPIEELNWDNWSMDSKLQVGVKILNLVVKVTNIAYTQIHKGSKRNSKAMLHVHATKEFKEWVKDNIDKNALLSPVTLPMVIEPKRYTTINDGGYYTPFIPRINLIKTRDREYLKGLQTDEAREKMKSVYAAVNVAQETPWRINKHVFTVFDYLWKENKVQTYGLLPQQEDKALPRCPLCKQLVNVAGDRKHECFVRDSGVFGLWKREARQVHELNAKNISKRLQIHKIHWAAEVMKDYEEIYFPYQLDFRGRIYAVTQYLNPQGCDIAKALLEFSEAKPIEDEEGARWLAIHTANVWGEDKISFEDRIQWVKDNEDMILAVADDALANREIWAKADSPWCFLSACYEWAGYKKDGYNHLSRIAVAQDGTCSGLQHYSALLRDSVGGKATNLTPSDKPQDIYAIVAKRTIEALEKIEPGAPDYCAAREWLESGLITRKLTKRSVMTLPYGSTEYSARDYVREHVEEVREKTPNIILWDVEDTQKACNFVTKYIWESIQETVIAASEAMKWLREIADIVVRDNDMRMSWVTPTGLPVLQTYTDAEYRRVKTYINGGIYITTKQKEEKEDDGSRENEIEEGKKKKRATTPSVYMTIKEHTDKLDAKRHKSGLAPNFIHSMDASSLVMAVVKANEDYGIASFALVHDSFGTHASDSAKLAKALRESFVYMYENNDVINMLYTSVKNKLPSDVASTLPAPPKKGNLDLKSVLDSKYIFA